MNKKFLKSIISTTLTLTLTITSITSVFASSFSDIVGHWSEEYINTLIDDGTITGYEDGTFRPDATVTRAEFVKIIGKGTTRFTEDFDDVHSNHWGYDYIMYSGMNVASKSFNPDIPILRGEVIELIWKRNGEITTETAPSIITNQATNKDAIAWAYANGILVGDDGLHLRLDETLTRGEASALIIRARNIDENADKKGFSKVLSDDIASTIYNSLNLFDTPYVADETITNGEMARAVLRYGMRRAEDLESLYRKTTPNFEGEYAKDLFLIGKECISKDNINEKFCNENAIISDTLAQLVYSSMKLIASSIKMPAQSQYADVKTADAKMAKYLGMASGYGIYLEPSKNINPDKEITKKEFMSLILQLDEVIGSQLVYETSIPSNASINKNVASYPENYEDYLCIIKDVPTSIYIDKFGDKLPKECTSYATRLASSFRTMLNDIELRADKKGYTLKTTFYPTLVSETSNTIIIRVKMEFASLISSEPISSFIKIDDEFSDFVPKSGDIVYADIQIPTLLDVYIDPLDAKIINILK